MITNKLSLPKTSLFFLTASSLLLVATPNRALGLTLDWNTQNWSSGTLSNSYSIDSGTVDMSFSGTTGAFVSGTPVNNTTLNGALTDKKTLYLQADFGQDTQSVTLTTQFNGYPLAKDVAFTIYDIDSSTTITPTTTSANWQDRLIITGFRGTETVNPTFTVANASNVIATGNMLDGIRDVPNAQDGGNVQVMFSSPIDRYTVQFTQDPAVTKNNPDSHGIALGDITYAAVPFEFSPTQGLLMVGGIWGLFYFHKRRRAAAIIDSFKEESQS
jgi:hypothetical protein